MYLNAQSIFGKLNELECMIMEVNPDAIVITESWCNENISNTVLQIKGYFLSPDLRKDRDDNPRGIGGGILVYVKNNLHILCHDNLSDFNQYCNFTVVNNQRQKVTIFAVYRSPNSTALNNDSLLNLISNVTEKSCVFIGDFNYPHINWNTGTSESKKGSDFDNILTSNNFNQVVNYATHIKGNILDLVFSNEPDLILYSRPIGRLGTSDHEIIEVGLNLSKGTQSEERCFLDWSKADIQSMNNYLDNIDWEVEIATLSTEMAWIKFKSELLSTQENWVPTRKSRTKNQPIWMDLQTLKLIKRKQRQWKTYKTTRSVEDWERYRTTEISTKKEIRKAKRRFEVRLSKKNNNKNAEFRRYVKSKSTTKNPIGPLIDGSGGMVSGDKEMAFILNTHFSNVFTREDSESVPILTIRENTPELNTVLFLLSDIKNTIKNLKDYSAPGPDLISSRLLKSVRDAITLPLQMIFNKSMTSGSVPSDWREAVVIPIFKKGTKGDPGNYRPISLTSIVCKVMETIIKEKVVAHLSRNKLIYSSQHGFTKKRSCTTNLLEFFEVVTKTIDQGVPVDVVYLDFAKAFDKVPRMRLVEKMRSNNIQGELISWISNWLSNRRQRVRVGEFYSDWTSVDSGVPQGSVLGPEAFRIYINDIDDAIRSVECINKFADDTKIAKQIRSEEDRQSLQSALDNLYEWTVTWDMRFNVSKCKIVHVGRNNPKYTYNIGGETLNSDSNEKDIGVLITENLKPSLQCQKSSNSSMAVLNQILRSFTYRDRLTYINLYKTYVRPHLEFSSPAWNPWTTRDEDIIEKVQIKAIKQVSGLKSNTYEERLKELDLTTLKDRRLRADLIQTYKIISGADDVDRRIWFMLNGDEERRVTRESEKPLNITGMVSNLDIRKYFFTNRVIKPWNSLPDNIQHAATVNQFKHLYDRYIKLTLQPC